MSSRLPFCLLLLILSFVSSAAAELQQGATRLGGSFRLESFEDETNADFEASSGYLIRNYLESGFVLGVTKREGSDTFGRAGANILWHILPERQVIPGVGLQLSRTFGYPNISGESGNFTVGEVFGNLEAFVTESWSFTMRGGYQSWWGEAFDARGFVFRAGISTFLGGKER